LPSELHDHLAGEVPDRGVPGWPVAGVGKQSQPPLVDVGPKVRILEQDADPDNVGQAGTGVGKERDQVGEH
jgi:hypothetical protein